MNEKWEEGAGHVQCVNMAVCHYRMARLAPA
jgi:hypothetical protein